jgi:mono/diheme cytochrome c family protein
MTRTRLASAALGFAMVLSASRAAAGDEGEQLFATNCAVCHMADGAGSPSLAPPLRNELWKRLGAKGPDYIASVMISGLVAVPLDGVRYAAAMPPWSQLSDAQLAAIGTHVLKKLNGTKTAVTAAQVKRARLAAPGVAELKAMRSGGG